MYPSWNQPPQEPQWGTPPPVQPWGPGVNPSWGAPQGPAIGWAIGLWVLAGFCLVGALVLGIGATAGFVIDNHMDRNGVTTSATVVDVAGNDVTVEFTTRDGERITAEFTWWPEDYPSVRDKVDITYDPDDPTYVIAAGSDEDQILATVIAAIAGVALLFGLGAIVGAVFVHRARRKAAQRSGGGYY
jgi:hypothetical protein